MGQRLWRMAVAVGVAVGVGGALQLGAQGSSAAVGGPLSLSLQPEPESVYAPPAPPSEAEGLNAGGINLDVAVSYLTDYVYRGVNYSRVAGDDDSATNLQVDAQMTFDLGKFPHPFVGVFANVYDADPVSRFQEIRPYFGADLTLRPLTFTGGHISYIYPEREEINRTEVFGQVQLDDSLIWRSERPVFSPYVYAAYDYEFNNGWYFEAGIEHEFAFDDWGLTITPQADIGLVSGYQQIFVFQTDQDTGFHHYDVGFRAQYSLNTLLNVSRRYGEWSLTGVFFYTAPLRDDNQVKALLWGGGGIELRY